MSFALGSSGWSSACRFSPLLLVWALRPASDVGAFLFAAVFAAPVEPLDAAALDAPVEALDSAALDVAVPTVAPGALGGGRVPGEVVVVDGAAGTELSVS